MSYCKEVTDYEKVLRSALGDKITRLKRGAGFIRKCRDLHNIVQSHKGTYPHVSMLISADYSLNLSITISVRHSKAKKWVLDKAKELGIEVINREEPTLGDHGMTYTAREIVKGHRVGNLSLHIVLVSDGTSKCRMVETKRTLVESYNIEYKIVCDDNGDSEDENVKATP